MDRKKKFTSGDCSPWTDEIKLSNGDCSPWTEGKNWAVATVRHGLIKKWNIERAVVCKVKKESGQVQVTSNHIFLGGFLAISRSLKWDYCKVTLKIESAHPLIASTALWFSWFEIMDSIRFDSIRFDLYSIIISSIRIKLESHRPLIRQ
jgi:hypothetical protein